MYHLAGRTVSFSFFIINHTCMVPVIMASQDRTQLGNICPGLLSHYVVKLKLFHMSSQEQQRQVDFIT